MAAEESSRAPETLESPAALIFRTSDSADKKFVTLANDIAGIKDNTSDVKREIADLRTAMLDEFEHVDAQFATIGDQLR